MSKKAEDIIKSINKEVGDGVLFMGDDKEKLDINWISTGLLSIDLASQPNKGSGGLPQGRIIELFGPQGSGKTTIALSTIAEAQKEGMVCAFLDNENAYNEEYAKMMGVDTDNLIFSKDNEGERTLDAVEALICHGELDMIVIDSVAGLGTKEELTSNMEKQHMALAARMWAKAMRKLKGALSRNNCTLILINQLRDNVGGYGSPKVTPGGNAIKFFADMRIDVRPCDKYWKGSGHDKYKYGHRLKVRFKKNKVGTAWGVAFADLYYDKGFNKLKDLLIVAQDEELIKKSGGWRSYIPLGGDEDDEIKANGIDNFIEAIKEKEDYKLIFKEMKEILLYDRTDPLFLEGEKEGD